MCEAIEKGSEGRLQDCCIGYLVSFIGPQFFMGTNCKKMHRACFAISSKSQFNITLIFFYLTFPHNEL